MDIKYRVKLSIAANNDLDEIFSYIAGSLSAEGAAKNLMREIYNELAYRYQTTLENIKASMKEVIQTMLNNA